MPNKSKLKWYVVSYYDGRNGHTYKQPTKAVNKVEAVYQVLGTTQQIKRERSKKITVRLFR